MNSIKIEYEDFLKLAELGVVGNFHERRRLLIQPGLACRPAIFLDRDGVIIEDVNYISKPEQVRLCKGIRPILRKALTLKIPIVIITNQSGISRGYFQWDDYDAVTNYLLDQIGNPSPISAIYANSYGPGALDHSWRKPSPAMLFSAAKDLNLDLSRSLLIGDRLTDLIAGARAGLENLVHVLNGHGIKERASIEKRINCSSCFIGEAYEPRILLIPSLEELPLALLTKMK